MPFSCPAQCNFRVPGLAREHEPTVEDGHQARVEELVAALHATRAIADTIVDTLPFAAIILASVLIEAFGLTAAEAEFSTSFVVERHLGRAAAKRGVSLSTARGYMKQLFQKTCTKRQAELMRLLIPFVLPRG